MTLRRWRPEKGKTDKYGNVVEDRIYNRKDYDKNLVIDERTQIVANKVTEFLKKHNRFDKTIIFCVDINHAERMRAAIANENADLVKENHKYVLQITGDNDEGKRELDNFINPEEKYPVIAATSKLMTTGVDAQTCKLIVLDSNIKSTTEFKQIIGRGTRINEDFGKYFFTIMDFRNVTDLFADPDFDGDPVRIKEIKQDEEIDFQEETENTPIIDEETGEEVEFPIQGETSLYPPEIIDAGDISKEPPAKYYVNGVNVSILNERVQFLYGDGNLITTNFKDYTKEQVKKKFGSLSDFLNKWNSADKKQAIIDELTEQGIIYENFREEINKEMDFFDLICHAAFDMPPLSRKERAENVKKRNYFTKYGEKARTVLICLLDKYEDTGIENIESMNVLKLKPISELGSPVEIVSFFGGKEKYIEALKELEQEIYKAA